MRFYHDCQHLQIRGFPRQFLKSFFLIYLAENYEPVLEAGLLGLVFLMYNSG
jgi:hypothetical protein